MKLEVSWPTTSETRPSARCTQFRGSSTKPAWTASHLERSPASWSSAKSTVAPNIRAVDAVGAAVSSDSEDMANARVRFENGCVATVTASRIALKTERKMRLFSEEGYLSADFVARRLVMIGRERGLPLPGTGGFRREEQSWGDHDSMAAEHEAFVARLDDPQRG